MTDQPTDPSGNEFAPTEMSDAEFREVVLRLLDRTGRPSIGHVMIWMGALEHAVLDLWECLDEAGVGRDVLEPETVAVITEITT